MSSRPRSIGSSVRIYRVLLGLYPASFREQYGSEMIDVFGELATDAVRRRGAVGLMMIWLRVLGDLAWTASRERLDELQEGLGMKTAAFAVLSVFLAAIVQLFFFALTAMAFWSVYLAFAAGRAGPGGAPATCLGGVAQWGLIYLPVFLTGAVLVRVRPFFMPIVTAPAAAMVIGGLIASQETAAPVWAAIGFVVSLGLASLLGCLVGSRLPVAKDSERPPIEWRRRSEVSRSSFALSCGVYLAAVLSLLAPYGGVAVVTIVGAWAFLAVVYTRWRLVIAWIIHGVGPAAALLLVLPLLLFLHGPVATGGDPGWGAAEALLGGDPARAAAEVLLAGFWVSVFFGFPVIAVVIHLCHPGHAQATGCETP